MDDKEQAMNKAERIKAQERLKLKSYDTNRQYTFLKEKFGVRKTRSCVTCPAGGKERVQSFGPTGGRIRCGIIGLVISTHNICDLIDEAENILNNLQHEIKI